MRMLSQAPHELSDEFIARPWPLSHVVLAFMTAWAQPAQAQSSIEIFGRIDAGVRYNGAPTESGRRDGWGVESGSYNSFGIKGRETIGPNLTAFFHLENYYDTATGRAQDPNAFFNETSAVGLMGRWGTLRLGRSDGPFVYGPIADAFAGDYVGGWGQRRAGANDKWRNGIMYWSPSWSGFQLLLGTALAERVTSQGIQLKDAHAMTLMYEQPKWRTSLGYHQRSNHDVAWGGSITYLFTRWQLFYTSAYNDGRGPEAISSGKRLNHDLGLAWLMSDQHSLRFKLNHDKHRGVVTTNVGAGYWLNLSKRTRFYITGTHQKTEGRSGFLAADMGMHHDF